VAANGYLPGDTVNVRGGDTFAGGLWVNPGTQPTVDAPITIQSYGTGRATFAPDTGTGVGIIECGYVTVQNINIAGPGLISSGTFPTRNVSTTGGSAFYLVTSDLTTHRAGIIVRNCHVTGVRYVMLAANSVSTTPTAAFSDMLIDSVTADNCGNGITVYGNFPFDILTRVNTRIKISNCVLSNITGITADNYGTGFPIFIANALDSQIEKCIVHDCGDGQTTNNTNGVAGIMLLWDTNCAIRQCEAYNIWSPQVVDGCAFDIDGNCVNCIVEYCYGHDSDGSVMLCWNTAGNPAVGSSGNIIRYNVFVNGGRRNQAGIAGCIAVTPNSGKDLLIHNNTCYQTANGSTQTNLIKIDVDSKAAFINNAFSVAGGFNFGLFTDSTLQGNTYDVRSGSTFSVVTASGSYASLAALHAAGYEKNGATLIGAQGDPLYASPGATSVVMPADPVSNLSTYDTSEGSATQSAGVILPYIPAPTFDWHGNLIGSSLDSGALIVGSRIPIPPPPPSPPASTLAPTASAWNDSFQTSLYKVAYNWYIIAQNQGLSGRLPLASDSASSLLSKSVDNTSFT
jgi:hypothetical protein